jgi:SAM-dependent methyltransferase
MLVLGRARHRRTASDIPNLERIARLEIDSILDWDTALSRLADRGLVVRHDAQVRLTRQGETWRREVHEKFPYWRYMYDTFFAQADASAAHSVFCRRVYGRDLCQHGMADMDQLAVLLDVLALDESSRVLDLGCANGRITEYLSDVSWASVTGVDISPVGIQQAQERTEDKRERLSFQLGNILTWSPGPDAGSLAPGDAATAAGFDTVLLTDTIYFVDAHRMLERAKRLVMPGGQIAILFSQWIRPGGSRKRLRPDGTVVGRALQRCGLEFWTWDFSEQEIAHWRVKLDVLARMRAAFEVEGNLWLFNFRLGEAKSHARTIGPHTRSRYLYLVPM